MKTLEFRALNEQDTDAFGAALASVLPPRATIALCGTLGAGKTRLVQAIAVASGVDRDDVTSPTFVICQHYHGANLIHHVDAYRIKDFDEWFELGVEELFADTAWTFVEWADRFEQWLPDEYLRIDIDVIGAHERLFRVTGIGGGMKKVVEAALNRTITE